MANGYSAGNLTVKFIGESKAVISSIDDIINRIEKLEKVTNNVGKGGNKNSFLSKFNLGYAYGKIRAITGAVSRMARFTSTILQNGVDYTETLNLWQVAMGDNLSMAQDFINQMNKAYGISEKTLMNAQAIFKNMIGSLGQISETTAYSISEVITQMAIDYSSLYNVSIESAITKFQAALAGQVRPIRSVSGYDITENTLYQLYQSIGGTKTIRNLSRTEKQLLSILAIFKQMGASGALGDMDKTINEVANQSRMMSENWQQLSTWAGVSLQYILKQYGVFRYINAALITAAEILKAIAFSLGYETPDFANSWADNVTETEEAVDELQGKLLDFDKFRSLSGAEQNVLGIDTKLLEAISGYSSEIGNATNEARELAEQWLKNLGFVDENGDGVYEITENAKTLGDVIKSIGENLAVIAAILLGMKIGTWLSTLSMGMSSIGGFATGLILAFSVLNTLIAALPDDLGKVASGLAIILGIVLAIWGAIKKGLAGAIIAGVGVGAVIAGIKGAIDITDYKNGGLPDKGTVFRAGEAGAEIVYNTPSGQSGVANIQQIAQATRAGTLQAVKEWWSQARNDIPQFREVSKTGIYEVAKGEMLRRGEW